MIEHSANHLTIQYRAAAAYRALVAEQERDRLAAAQRQRNSIINWLVETMHKRLQVLIAPADVMIEDVPKRNLARVSVTVDGLTFFAEGRRDDPWGRSAYDHNPRLCVSFPCPRCGQLTNGYAGSLEQLGETLTNGTPHYLDGGLLCEATDDDAERDGAAWEDAYGGLEHAEVAS